MNPNTPIMVGVAQMLYREFDPDALREPADMMVDAVRDAIADTGNPDLVNQLESIRVIRGIWRYKNPAAYVAGQLGLSGVETYGSPFGGNTVQSMVNQTAVDILSGDTSLAVITGAEYGNTQAKAAKAGIELSFKQADGTYDRMLGEEVPMMSDVEKARGIQQPIQVYPMVENALRNQRGETIDAHLKRISELWAGFSRVASGNPNAWLQDPVDAESIRTPSASNRMVSFPYPKLMNSNNAVDMSAALVMCSVQKARALGIPESQWVYPWTGTDAHDHYFFCERDNLYSSPAIRLAGGKAMELAGLGPQDIDLLDIYSCFPSAVQVGATELGFSMDRDLTVTGGLTFGGGPLNNYVMHSIARMVELCREQQGKKGMITANGGYLTKHAFGIYSSEPPAQDFQHASPQAEVDALPKRQAVVDFEGEAMIETYSVMFDAQGPAVGHAACLTADGVRTFANTKDRDLAEEMTRSEFCGMRTVLDGKGKFSV